MNTTALFDVDDELERQDENKYRILKFLGRGGTGEVYRLSSELHGSNRIVKLFLPFYFLEKVRGLGLLESPTPAVTQQVFQHFEGLKIGTKEYKTLAELNHPFVVRVHDLVRVDLPKHALERLHLQFDLPADARAVFGIIANFVEGFPLLDFARTANSEEVMEALHGVAQALDYLNLDMNMLHCDVKNENVLVQRGTGLPVVVDFGLAEDPRDNNERRISIDSSLVPTEAPTSEARAIRRRLAEGEAVGRVEFRAAFHPWLDRFQFGLLIREIAQDSALERPERLFLEELGSRLLDVSWLLRHGETGIAELVERTNTNRVYPLVRTGSREGDLHIPSPNRRINLPPPLVPLAQHPSLVRLNRQNQLGLLPARFPAATHTRFLHSLDTYRMTRALTRTLLDKPEFRVRMSDQDVMVLLVAALFHDVNHVPLLHVFQELPDKDWLPNAFDMAVQYGSETGKSLETLLKDRGLDLGILAALLDTKSKRPKPTKLTDAQLLSRSIISGAVDTDKLSYLQLDSRFSGLSFASGMDIDAVFEFADVGIYDSGVEEPRPVLCFREEGIDAVLAVIRSRTEGFERLYWCSENRAMMAAVLRKVRSILQKPGGSESLSQVVMESIAASDYTFLERVDSCAVDHEIRFLPLASFFDGSWGQLSVATKRRARDVIGAISVLDADKRLTVEKRLSGALTKHSIARSTKPTVLVDIPARALDLGGDLFIKKESGEVALATENWQELKPFAERLKALAETVTIFIDRGTEEGVRRKGHDPGEVVWSELKRGIETSWK